MRVGRQENFCDKITGREIELLIMGGIRPLFLRRPTPTSDLEHATVRTELFKGAIELSYAKPLRIMDGLLYRSPILFHQAAIAALGRIENRLKSAENYRAQQTAYVEAALGYGAVHTLEPIQGAELPPLQAPAQQPPVLPQTEV